MSFGSFRGARENHHERREVGREVGGVAPPQHAEGARQF